MAGLADFGERLDLPGGPVWPVFGRPATWVAAPTKLRLADHEGAPAFALTIVRPPRADSATPPYAMLDVELAIDRDMADALSALRADIPGVTLWPAQIDEMRLQLARDDGTATLPSQRSSGRMTMHLDMDEAQFLEMALASGEAPLILRGAVSVMGVSPRVASVAQVDMPFLTALRALFDADALSRDALAFALAGMGLTQRLDLMPAVPPGRATDLADALADRVLATWGVVHSLDPSGVPRFALSDELSHRVWDLGAPFACARWMPLDAEPLTALADVVAAQGEAAVIARREMAALPQGQHRIELHLNMPLDAAGLQMAQVSLIAPANPPDRPAPAQAVALFMPGGAAQSDVTLPLALGEPLLFDMQALAVVGTGADMRQTAGTRLAQRSQALVLAAQDFGLDLLQFEVDQALLAAGRVTLNLHYTVDGVAVMTPLQVTTRTLTTLIPAQSDMGRMELTVDGETALARIEDLPLASMTLGPALFPSFGQHDVQVRAEPPPAGVLGVEFQTPDGRVQTLSLTAATPSRQIRFWSDSIFGAALLWRPMGAAEWGIHADPGQPLEIGG